MKPVFTDPVFEKYYQLSTRYHMLEHQINIGSSLYIDDQNLVKIKREHTIIKQQLEEAKTKLEALK